MKNMVLSLSHWEMARVRAEHSAPHTLALTRSARRISNSANVPRFGQSPNLLLDLAKPQVHAALDTQRTLLASVGIIAELMGSTVLVNLGEI
jgi:hypothetical protein